jgi:hypothetical protein
MLVNLVCGLLALGLQVARNRKHSLVVAICATVNLIVDSWVEYCWANQNTEYDRTQCTWAN